MLGSDLSGIPMPRGRCEMSARVFYRIESDDKTLHGHKAVSYVVAGLFAGAISSWSPGFVPVLRTTPAGSSMIE